MSDQTSSFNLDPKYDDALNKAVNIFDRLGSRPNGFDVTALTEAIYSHLSETAVETTPEPTPPVLDEPVTIFTKGQRVRSLIVRGGDLFDATSVKIGDEGTVDYDNGSWVRVEWDNGSYFDAPDYNEIELVPLQDGQRVQVAANAYSSGYDGRQHPLDPYRDGSTEPWTGVISKPLFASSFGNIYVNPDDGGRGLFVASELLTVIAPQVKEQPVKALFAPTLPVAIPEVGDKIGTEAQFAALPVGSIVKNHYAFEKREDGLWRCGTSSSGWTDKQFGGETARTVIRVGPEAIQTPIPVVGQVINSTEEFAALPLGSRIEDHNGPTWPAEKFGEGWKYIERAFEGGLYWADSVFGNESPRRVTRVGFDEPVEEMPKVGDKLTNKDYANLPLGSVVSAIVFDGWVKTEKGWTTLGEDEGVALYSDDNLAQGRTLVSIGDGAYTAPGASKPPKGDLAVGTTVRVREDAHWVFSDGSDAGLVSNHREDKDGSEHFGKIVSVDDTIKGNYEVEDSRPGNNNTYVRKDHVTEVVDLAHPENIKIGTVFGYDTDGDTWTKQGESDFAWKNVLRDEFIGGGEGYWNDDRLRYSEHADVHYVVFEGRYADVLEA